MSPCGHQLNHKTPLQTAVTALASPVQPNESQKRLVFGQDIRHIVLGHAVQELQLPSCDISMRKVMDNVNVNSLMSMLISMIMSMH